MTSYFINEESERLFAFYPEWKQTQLIRYAKELGYKIHVTKCPCPQILYYYSKKYHPNIVNDPLIARDDYINVLTVEFIGKRPQSIFSGNVIYLRGIFEVGPIEYKSQTLTLFFDNKYSDELFFVETEDERVYASVFTKENDEGVSVMWIKYGDKYDELYMLSPEMVERIKSFVNSIIEPSYLTEERRKLMEEQRMMRRKYYDSLRKRMKGSK